MLSNRREFLLYSAAGVALSASATASASYAAKAPAGSPALATLLANFANEMLAKSPETCTSLGLDAGARATQKTRLDDRSVSSMTARVADSIDRKNRLQAIDRATLSGADATYYDTVVYNLDCIIAGGKFSYGDPAVISPYIVSQQHGSFNDLPEFLDSQHLINDKADADSYLARLELIAVAMDQETERMARDAAQGVMLPDYLIATALGEITDIRNTKPTESRMVTSVATRATAKNIAGDYAGAASKIVADKIYPALDRQIAALKAIQPKANHDAGVWKLPDGEAYYAWALKNGTTTNLTPDEVHTIGLDQSKALDARMDERLKKQGMNTGTVGERMAALTKDPRFLYPNTDEGRAQIISYLNGRIAALRPITRKISRMGLKADVQVKRVPVDIQNGSALGYMNFASLDGKRPAIYYVNLADNANWPKWQLPSLTAHEAIPGHAWQGAYLAEKHDDLPLIASLMQFNAFVEGWALYAEQLADEYGLYADDAFGELGYLQAIKFRANRLVVDTGLHAKRWGREQAIDWMVAASGRTKKAITSEVDRYCAGPGQACGYKIGQNEILRLREKAKTSLAGKFDIRDFNDRIVQTGGVPLAVLESVVDRYIKGA